MDHWQWGATLWRGAVGADVTVAVQKAAPIPLAVVGAAGHDTSPGNNTHSHSSKDHLHNNNKGGVGGDVTGGHEKGRNGGSGGSGSGVEVRLEDARAVVVRGEREGGVGEGGLRRVGFEIGEWVRGWEEREEERAGRRGS